MKINDVKDKEYFFLREWQLDNCYWQQEEDWTGNTDIPCCISPGEHILTCSNLRGSYGWGDASLTIQGQQYCDDFVGFKARRKVLILGRYYIHYV